MSRDAELDAFVDLLRSATPDEATLSQAKAATLARASAGAGTAAFHAPGLMHRPPGDRTLETEDCQIIPLHP